MVKKTVAAVRVNLYPLDEERRRGRGRPLKC
jgi:hypothetical protein